MALPAEQSELPAMEIGFQGETLLIDPRGCLYWPREGMLIVSDLHLEKGSSFAAKRGNFMPPYDTHATLERLALCVTDWQPKTILSLGDSFHDNDASLRLPQSCRLALRQLMEGREWIWVCGNHDPEPPENLGGTFCTEMMLGPLNFLHEPQAQFRYGEIAGHLHPAAKIRRRGKAVRRRCMVGDGRRLIMPAFGAFTGGLNVKDAAFDNLFESTELQSWLLGQNAVYQISGSQLVP
ncbi:MAG: ligase-associated DNA damage response endonuclease PdeM [Rhizobiaceae bacterium]|nr:ligase-associated DNA damage response endonuclease PdeM [Rhizobiaceae bacterium]